MSTLTILSIFNSKWKCCSLFSNKFCNKLLGKNMATPFWWRWLNLRFSDPFWSKSNTILWTHYQFLASEKKKVQRQNTWTEETITLQNGARWDIPWHQVISWLKKKHGKAGEGWLCLLTGSKKLERSTEENRKTVTGTGPRSVSILAKIFLVPEKVWLPKGNSKSPSFILGWYVCPI